MEKCIFGEILTHSNVMLFLQIKRVSSCAFNAGKYATSWFKIFNNSNSYWVRWRQFRLISDYNFPWNNLGSESPREDTFIMRQNGLLWNTKTARATRLNLKGQPRCLFWSLVCPFRSPFSKALRSGMQGWMRRHNEEWRGGMKRSYQRSMTPPVITKAFMRPFLIARLSVQELIKTSQPCGGTLSSVFTKCGNANKSSNVITNFIPLGRDESFALLSIWQPLAPLTTWIWAAPSNLAHKLRPGTREEMRQTPYVLLNSVNLPGGQAQRRSEAYKHSRSRKLHGCIICTSNQMLHWFGAK